MSTLNAFLPTVSLLSTAVKVGIPGLPDLTQPSHLVATAYGLIVFIAVGGILFIGLGLVLALLNFTLKHQQSAALVAVGDWVMRYTQLVRFCQQAALILSMLVLGFLLCSTLANRYHGWEQSKFVRASSDRLEQVAPQVKYTVKEPFSYNTQLNGRVVKVQDRKDVTKVLLPASSNIQVKITTSPVADRANLEFLGEYNIRNTAPPGSSLTLLLSPPQGAAAIQNFVVEQDGQRLNPLQIHTYALPLAVNGSSQLRVSYQAQGAPRWFYNTQGQLLSDFKLVVKTNADQLLASGSLQPSATDRLAGGRTFTWTFTDNVTVGQPFGVEPTIKLAKQVGIFPRLLIIAPAIWLWWVILLFLSVPMRLRDVAATGGVFWVALWILVYSSRVVRAELFSRFMTPEILWLIISAVLLLFTLLLGRVRRTAFLVCLCTVVGFILPVLGLLGSYSGLVIGVAGLLSLGWLAAPQWYGRPWQTMPKRRRQTVHAVEKSLADEEMV